MLRSSLIAGKLKDIDCQPLIDKITSKITSWTSRFLSFDGRLHLIDFVLFSLQNFWCSMFLFPFKVIEKFEHICNSFLWKGTAGNALGAKSFGKMFACLKLKVVWD